MQRLRCFPPPPDRDDMTRTLFTTPVLSPLLCLMSRLFLRATGWRVQGALPPEAARSVIIAAPHTSNWDLPYTLMMAFALGLHIRWLGKRSIFRAPFGGVMRWLGGIEVNRETSSNLVAASAQALTAAPGALQLVVAPEGTRGRTRHWKTGFYFIAVQAQVPVVLAYLDYEKKVGGIGPLFRPTGDVDADMAQIRRFYAPIKGKRPEAFEAGDTDPA